MNKCEGFRKEKKKRKQIEKPEGLENLTVFQR
jgi:hypothetical protein